MDAETQAAIAHLEARLEGLRQEVAGRVRWLSVHHEREWRTAADARVRWDAELDALEVEVNLLQVAVRILEKTIMATPEDRRSQHQRIYAAVNAASDAFVEVLFDLLPADRVHLKERFQTTLGTLWAEVLGGSTTLAAGAVVSIDQRVATLEQRAVGDSGDGT